MALEANPIAKTMTLGGPTIPTKLVAFKLKVYDIPGIKSGIIVDKDELKVKLTCNSG